MTHVEELLGADVEIVETETTVWYLDRSGQRFARTARAEHGVASPLAFQWQECARIEFDAATRSYALYLDDEGRRVIRFR